MIPFLKAFLAAQTHLAFVAAPRGLLHTLSTVWIHAPLALPFASFTHQLAALSAGTLEGFSECHSAGCASVAESKATTAALKSMRVWCVEVWAVKVRVGGDWQIAKDAASLVVQEDDDDRD